MFRDSKEKNKKEKKTKGADSPASKRRYDYNTTLVFVDPSASIRKFQRGVPANYRPPRPLVNARTALHTCWTIALVLPRPAKLPKRGAGQGSVVGTMNALIMRQDNEEL